MPQIPQYNREVKLNGQALPYQKLDTNEYTFGGAEAKALMRTGDDVKGFVRAADMLSDRIDDAKMLELSNQISQWEEINLYDKENGYFFKTGKEAVGQSEKLMKDFDEFVQGYISNNNISKINEVRMHDMVSKNKLRISHGVNSWDVQQTKKWAKNESELGLANAIKGMVKARNNPDDIKTQLANINTIIDWQGQTEGLDSAAVEVMKQNAVSEAHSAVLDAYIAEGDLRAGKYFEDNKDSINPDKHAKYISAIKNEEMKYKARDMALNIISSAKSEEDAIKKAEAIKDVNLSDIVLSRVKHHYTEQEHFKRLQERELLDGFYNKVLQKQQNGQSLSYDDIPNELDPQTKLSLMNYVNSNGQPETENDIWENLYDMSVNNAQGFAKEDLNKYRGFLSESDFKSFTKRQQDIKSGGYYTIIKDDDKKIDAALDAVGLKNRKKEAVGFSEVKALVREYEARKGRKINDDELSNIISSLGYKGADKVQIYKQLEKGMGERAGFVRDVINDFVYYQTKHNGELPSDAEKEKIILNRVNQKVQEKRTTAQQNISVVKDNATVMRNIAYIVAKPNEQKVLTYFADNQVPTISKQLGIKLTVTSRYRNQPGSHHKEGRAADVSMSEHKAKDRIRIYEKLLGLPTVLAIGTSDINILSHFNGTELGKKLVDERKYDKQHGTDHINHAHVTLINANPAKPTGNRVASNNVYKF